LAVTATGCGSPYETVNGSLSKSGAVRPTAETGFAGSWADLATDSANGMFFSNSAWISASESGKLKTLSQSSGSNASSGSTALAVAQVAISGVNATTPASVCAYSIVSPFVV
jgi:hypothetical protein